MPFPLHPHLQLVRHGVLGICGGVGSVLTGDGGGAPQVTALVFALLSAHFAHEKDLLCIGWLYHVRIGGKKFLIFKLN